MALLDNASSAPAQHSDTGLPAQDAVSIQNEHPGRAGAGSAADDGTITGDGTPVAEPTQPETAGGSPPDPPDPPGPDSRADDVAELKAQLAQVTAERDQKTDQLTQTQDQLAQKTDQLTQTQDQLAEKEGELDQVKGERDQIQGDVDKRQGNRQENDAKQPEFETPRWRRVFSSAYVGLAGTVAGSTAFAMHGASALETNIVATGFGLVSFFMTLAEKRKR